MRTSSAIILASVASCLLAGCETSAAKMAKSSGAPAAAMPSGSADSTSNPLDLLTSKIDTTITLGAWLKSHPGDKVGVVPPVTNIDDPFCRSAVAKTHLLGRTLVRSALFYIPAPPKGEKLPTDTATAAAGCELRTVVLESEEMNFPAGHALGDSIARLVDKRLGEHRDSLTFGAGGLRGLEGGKMWSGPGTSVVVGTESVGKVASKQGKAVSNEEEELPTPSVHAATGKTFAVAYAPGSGAQDFDLWDARYKGQAAQRAEDQQSLYRNVDSALTWAALPAVTADLKTVLVFLRTRDVDKPGDLRPPQVDVALLRAIKAINSAAPSLPAPRRAAALLAGDVALFATLATFNADTNQTISRTLDLLGISFAPLPGENGYQNTRRWLWEAYRLDSAGRAGRAAFVELLGLRWPVTGACQVKEYARMIEQGEAELKKGNNDPLVHFYVGAAYKTIYDFANFSGGDYAPDSSVKQQSESARLKGIEHFRAALESLPNGPVRREAWMKAMQLLLRRTGEQPEYVCFED
jgi:hypothetical protein